ncbi:hypothetical protein JCM5353_006255 [Sporobolomyces roseus]
MLPQILSSEEDQGNIGLTTSTSAMGEAEQAQPEDGQLTEDTIKGWIDEMLRKKWTEPLPDAFCCDTEEIIELKDPRVKAREAFQAFINKVRTSIDSSMDRLKSSSKPGFDNLSPLLDDLAGQPELDGEQDSVVKYLQARIEELKCEGNDLSSQETKLQTELDSLRADGAILDTKRSEAQQEVVKLDETITQDEELLKNVRMKRDREVADANKEYTDIRTRLTGLKGSKSREESAVGQNDRFFDSIHTALYGGNASVSHSNTPI